MDIKLRNEISDEFKWDLTHLYKNKEEIDSDYNNCKNDIEILKQFNGLLNNPIILKKLFGFN